MTRRELLKSLLAAVLAVVLPSRSIAQKNTATNRSSVKSVAVKTVPQVLRIQKQDAVCWDYRDGDYTKGIDFASVKAMLAAGLTGITATTDTSVAWRKLIVPYRLGDKIVIKPNIGNIHLGYQHVLMTSPQVIAAVAQSLVAAGFPASDILVYDLTAHDDLGILSPWLDPLGIERVLLKADPVLVDKIARKFHLGLGTADIAAPIRMRQPVRDKEGTEVQCYMPRIVTAAQHLINVPVFKAHQFVLQSSALKNHFGTVRFGNGNQYPVILHGEYLESHIADINANPHISEKTRLCIADALLGAGCFDRDNNGRSPHLWKSIPGGTPNSLFFSRDPVALESVLADYISRELVQNDYSLYPSSYLPYAADLGLGVYERRSRGADFKHIDLIEKVL